MSMRLWLLRCYAPGTKFWRSSRVPRLQQLHLDTRSFSQYKRNDHHQRTLDTKIRCLYKHFPTPCYQTCVQGMSSVLHLASPKKVGNWYHNKFDKESYPSTMGNSDGAAEKFHVSGGGLCSKEHLFQEGPNNYWPIERRLSDFFEHTSKKIELD